MVDILKTLPVQIQAVIAGSLITIFGILVQNLIQLYLQHKNWKFQNIESSKKRNLEIKKDLLFEASESVLGCISFLISLSTKMRIEDGDTSQYMEPIKKWQKLYLVANTDTLRTLDKIGTLYNNIFIDLMNKRIPIDKDAIDLQINKNGLDIIGKRIDETLSKMKMENEAKEKREREYFELLKRDFDLNMKDSKDLSDEIKKLEKSIFDSKKELYNYTCGLLVELIKESQEFLKLARSEIDINIDHEYWDKFNMSYLQSLQLKMNDLFENLSDDLFSEQEQEQEQDNGTK